MQELFRILRKKPNRKRQGGSMIRPRMLSGLMALLLVATGAATPGTPTSAQEPAPSTTAPADTPPVIKLGKMDPKHPAHIGTEYYPKESRKHHEQGTRFTPELQNGLPVEDSTDIAIYWRRSR
jgi:hypothetical protein